MAERRYAPPDAAPDDGYRLADASDEWLCELDADLAIRWTNGRVRQAVGLEPPQTIGRPWAEVAGIAWPDDVLEAVRRRAPVDLEWGGPSDDGDGSRRMRIRLRPAPGRGWTLACRETSREHALATRAARLTELLDTAQEFGRLGVWERELPSGKGRWDRHVFRFWGLEPSDRAPSFEQASQRIHPDDQISAYYGESIRQPGRYGARYRVVREDGQVRRIHSQWEVKARDGHTPDRIVGVMLDDTEAYAAARSAHESNDQLRLVAELANVTIWKHDLRTNRIFHSIADWLLPHFVPSPAGMPIEQLRELIHPDDLATVTRSAQRAIETGRPVDFEARYRSHEGGWRHVLSRRVLQRDEKGQPAAFLGVSLDVTEQVCEQRRSTELARRLGMAVAAAGIGLWSRRVDGSEPEWNEQMFAIYGRDRSLGPPSYDEWLRSVHPDDLPDVQASVGEVRRRAGATVSTQFRIVHPDGAVRWIENRATMEPSEPTPLLYGVALDMTGRVQTELALRSLNDRIQMAARGAGIGTWVLDMRTGQATWDEQMFRLRGLEPGAQTPDADTRLAMVHPDDRHLLVAAATPSDEGIGALAIEFRIVWPDGSTRWIASRSSTVLDPTGRPALRVGVNWDITEAKAADQAREEREAAMLESRAKSQLLARVSHELRTPLNAILGFAQLLLLDLPPGTDPFAKVDNIRRAGEHLLTLVNDVLELTRLQTGGARLARDELPLTEAINDAITLLAEYARTQQVTLVVGKVEGRVVGDAPRLRQVLLNVMNNAIKFNRPGGTVHIDARVDGPMGVVRIRDDGPGIPPGRLSQVGEPFNRLGAEQRGIEGTGIGLTIVKALVEAMHGRFEIASTPGSGTEVQIALPAIEHPAVDPARSEPSAAPPQATPETADDPADAPGQLLYIEDNPVNVLLMQELVRSRPGLALRSATTGLEGVAAAQALPTEVVLIDMQLPDIDGYQVLRRLRADPRTQALPCVALSANAMPEDIERALAAGFDEYWTKPIEFRAFFDGVQRLLARARSAALHGEARSVTAPPAALP
jgi:signal transduction histidine kinase/CheY-like chemotaxis protein